jgi:hypothetical protein
MSNVANANAQAFLLASWKQAAPIDRSNALYQMLTSSNIAISSSTYQLMIDIAIHGHDLEMATKLHLEMERLTGATLPRATQDKMVDLHLFSSPKGTNQCQKRRLSGADAAKDEIVANLTKHPWFGNFQGKSQKHQIYMASGASGGIYRLFCLSMTGEASGQPKFDNFELHWSHGNSHETPWGSQDGNSLQWGRGHGTRTISLGSTNEEIKQGSLTWNGYKGNWQWFASQSLAVA